MANTNNPNPPEVIDITTNQHGDFTIHPSTMQTPQGTTRVEWRCHDEHGNSIPFTVQFSNGSPFTGATFYNGSSVATLDPNRKAGRYRYSVAAFAEVIQRRDGQNVLLRKVLSESGAEIVTDAGAGASLAQSASASGHTAF